MKRFLPISAAAAGLAAVCAVAVPAVTGAQPGLVQKGGLRVAFDAGFAPKVLPRDRNVPVTVKVRGSVRTADRSRPPQLRQITIAVNRYGRLSTRGLPTCTSGRLETTTSRVALERCRPALVGQGKFAANVDFPDAPPFPVAGRMLAFNGERGGRPVILLHIHGSNPIEATVVLTFRIKHPRRGRFGTVLTTRIPLIASDLGYVTDVGLSFSRIYRHAGQRRSFLSARCAAPAGFTGAIFSFARGTFDFAGGKRLTTTLVRDCRVRR